MKTGIIAVAACLSLSLVARADEFKNHIVRGQKNLSSAESSLRDAASYIEKSQKANECVFKVEGGHGEKAKAAIHEALRQLWEAGEWVIAHEKECEGTRHKPVAVQSPPRNDPDMFHHLNLTNASLNLIMADYAMYESQRINECVFGLEGGHGEQARAAIEEAIKEMREISAWIGAHPKDCH
jgi:hypothetical protein